MDVNIELFWSIFLFFYIFDFSVEEGVIVWKILFCKCKKMNDCVFNVYGIYVFCLLNLKKKKKMEFFFKK